MKDGGVFGMPGNTIIRCSALYREEFMEWKETEAEVSPSKT